MIENLDTLRKTAEAATPGPWVLDGFAEGGCSEGCCEEYTRLSVYSGTNQGEVVASEVTAQRNADYFDTFNPETVLALLSRLEQAEQAVERVRRLHKKLPYRVGARNTGIPEFVCEACHGEAWGAVEYPCPTIRALDGDTRRLADDALGGDNNG